MLAIRLQRRGRKGHAQFRVIVQDSRFNPKSGRVVENLGAYDPHTKVAAIDVARAEHFLKNGAQPSERVVKILQQNKVSLPAWVKEAKQNERSVRNPEKLRKNQPKEEAVAEEAPATDDEAVVETDETAAAEEAKD